MNTKTKPTPHKRLTLYKDENADTPLASAFSLNLNNSVV